VSERCLFDYAVIRLVPQVELEEFINVGVIVSCRQRQFLESRIRVNSERLRCFAPNLDLASVNEYLDAIPKTCRGGDDAGEIGRLTQRERFYWLTAQRSTIIQSSPVHTGWTEDPCATLEALFAKIVR
jgi:hypothetical protein